MNFYKNIFSDGMTDKRQYYWDIFYKPKTGEQVRAATFSNPPIYLYSELVKMMREKGAANVLYAMMRRNHDSLILVQDPKNLRSGHWTSLSFHPDKKEVYFFSSYGGKPDAEKNEWLPASGLFSSGQDLNVFNDGLKTLMKRDGWEVHYNQYPYQVVGDNTATCGIWCAAFMNSRLNPDEFNRYVKYGGYDPIVFYRLFFV